MQGVVIAHLTLYKTIAEGKKFASEELNFSKSMFTLNIESAVRIHLLRLHKGAMTLRPYTPSICRTAP